MSTLLLPLPAGPARDELAQALRAAGWDVQLTGPGEAHGEALAAVHVALLDADQLELAPDLAQAGVPWLALVRNREEETRALEAGADDVLAPGAPGPAALRRLEHVRELAALQRERYATRGALAHEASETLARHPELDAALERVAGTPRTTILLSGTVRDPLACLASTIHARSARSTGPFVITDASRVTGKTPHELLMQARGGTLFLDRVEALDPAQQAAWAACAASGEVTRHEDVRLIVGSRCDLAERVARGAFREDLLYRWNVLSLRVPPDRPARPMQPEGNDAVPETASASSTGGWLPRAPMQRPSTCVDQGQESADGSLRDMEEALIRRVLAREAGNRSRTAAALGIHRTTLYSKLRAYGIE